METLAGNLVFAAMLLLGIALIIGTDKTKGY